MSFDTTTNRTPFTLRGWPRFTGQKPFLSLFIFLVSLKFCFFIVADQYCRFFGYHRCVETNLGIISGAMLCLPVFYRESHLLASLKSRLLSSRLSNQSSSRIRSPKKSSDHGESLSLASRSVSSGGFPDHETPQKKEGRRGGPDVNDSSNDNILLPYSSSLSEDQSHNHPSYPNNNHNSSNSDKHPNNSEGIVKTNEYIVISEQAPSPSSPSSPLRPHHQCGQREA